MNKEHNAISICRLADDVKAVIRLTMTIIVGVLLLAGSLFATVPLSDSPVWSCGYGGGPAGAGWVDLDGNGWHDLVVALGVDAYNQPCIAFYNFDGQLPTSPDWISDHRQTHCQLFLGDLDADGDPDLVVSSLGRTSQGFPLVPQLVYYNNGGLSSVPDWQSPDANSFSCTGGDPDGDGDLDIVFAQGNAASSSRQHTMMYINEGGTFDPTAGWATDSVYYGVDVAFVDIDLDGDLDLALGGKYMGVAVFYNDNGVLETTPSWQTNQIIGGRQISFGDIDGDDYPDLAAAGANQNFFLFRNLNGILENTPSWEYSSYWEPSCVAWGDADGDGDLDLAGGSWLGRVGVFENNGGSLSSTPVWEYNTGNSMQQVAWADFDQDFLVDTTEQVVSDGVRKLFCLPKRPVHTITSIEIGGVPLEPNEYCSDPLEGWISLGTPPSTGDTLTISYRYSRDLDLTVTSNVIHIFENEFYTNPPEGINILLLLDHGLGANYDIVDGSQNILEQLEAFGWNITTAGLSETITRCGYAASAGCVTQTVDYLLSDIPDVTNYDIVCLLPGASGLPNMYASEETHDFLRTAAAEGVIVAAWCRGVRVLAAADLIDGLEVVGHASYQSVYEAAGATYLGDNHPPIIEGNIITAVRSRYYRTAMCQAMASALPPTIDSTGHTPLEATSHDTVTITATITDYGTITSALAYVDTGAGFFAIAMSDDGNHNDGTIGDSVYGAFVPPLTGERTVPYYVSVTDEVGITVLDPPEAPGVTYSYSSFGCCVGLAGNVDNDPEDNVDLGDLTSLIDFLFISFEPPACPEEANIDGDVEGLIDLSDLTRLIDYLFISFAPPAACM